MSKKGLSRDLVKMAKILKAALAPRISSLKFALFSVCFRICISAIIAGVSLSIDVMDDSRKEYNASEYYSEDIHSVSESETLTEPSDIVLQPMPEGIEENNFETGAPASIIINCDGEQKPFNVTRKTVSGALAEAGYRIGENDLVSPSGDSAVYDGMTITVMRTEVVTLDYTVDIPYETEYRKSSDLYVGESKVIREGALGKQKITLQQTLHNGIMVESRTLSAIIISDPISRIVAEGTKKKPSPTTATTKKTTKKPSSTTKKEPPEIGDKTIEVNGVVYNITKAINGRAVSYYSSSSNPLTYTGNPAIPGKTVAVDPSVIPLGSLLYIASLDDGKTWSYGPAYAHDIGGGIKGTYVDLFMASKADCYKFGNRNCVIYIITPAN
jgi:3D (Asp-Asp-Asp) domain-containing protein